FENFSEDLTLDELAAISRIGSGASVRSFMNGVVLWDRLTIRQIELPIIKGGSHVVLVINDSKKKISSSQAHQRVSSSALLEDRPRRVKERLERMIRPDVSWQDLFMIVWNEFWDMMALFETSRPPFGYFCGPTVEILNFIRDYWENKNDGPLVTMDAGPNIHLIFRQDHGSNLKEELLREIKQRWNIQMFFSAI
ncbi:MAG: hypothetical protein NZ480_02490, partial [Bdellovibrionaceae bacterium]|nr:hypothetical protein [Pseudobdellovibrionaceae bacterium]